MTSLEEYMINFGVEFLTKKTQTEILKQFKEEVIKSSKESTNSKSIIFNNVDIYDILKEVCTPYIEDMTCYIVDKLEENLKDVSFCNEVIVEREIVDVIEQYVHLGYKIDQQNIPALRDLAEIVYISTTVFDETIFGEYFANIILLPEYIEFHDEFINNILNQN